MFVGAECEIRKRDAKEPGDVEVAFVVRMMGLMKSVQCSPHRTEDRAVDSSLPPLIGLVMHNVDRFVQKIGDREGGVSANENRQPREREGHGREERGNGCKEQRQRQAARHDLWVDKYRPGTLADLILPARLKEPFQAMVDRGLVPNMTLSGSPGIGKTSLARVICNQSGTDTLVVNASDERGIDFLREKIKPFAFTCSFWGGRKYLILEEADGLTRATQNALKALIEEAGSNCGFILITNNPTLDPALVSRCPLKHFDFRPEERSDLITRFLERAAAILQAESVAYDPNLLSQVINRWYPDFRRTLGELQAAVVNGRLSADALA